MELIIVLSQPLDHPWSAVHLIIANEIPVAGLLQQSVHLSDIDDITVPVDSNVVACVVEVILAGDELQPGLVVLDGPVDLSANRLLDNLVTHIKPALDLAVLSL